MTRSVGRHGLEYYRSHFRESIQRDGAVCLECGKLRLTAFRHGDAPAPIASRSTYRKGRLIAKTASARLLGPSSAARSRDLGSRSAELCERNETERDRRAYQVVSVALKPS